jgi:UDP-N-acetylglucosamine 2-epimerase (non-hydrolysing)
MMYIVFGTTGELIKLFPVIEALEESNSHYKLLCTAQQIEELPSAIQSLGINVPINWLANGYKGESLRSKKEMLIWAVKLSFRLARLAPSIYCKRKSSGVMVHGDTVTTSIGALFGWIVRTPVFHVEAGMRSGDWKNPFPEELSRRFVAKLAAVNYAPGTTSCENLANSPGDIVDTQQNTIVDALRLAIHQNAKALSQEPVGLISLHRSELYEDETRFREILTVLASHGREHKMLFIDHPVTIQRMKELGLDQVFSGTLVEQIEKLNYFQFISVLSKSSYVVTDSGGLQQECEVTGHPCLVHRAVTESTGRLDQNIVLSRLDIDVVNSFLDNPSRFSTPEAEIGESPTQIIISDLKTRGLVS